MIIDRCFCIEGHRPGTVISMRVEFDKYDEAHAFNLDLVDLYLKHLRLTTPPYEYKTPEC